MRKVKELSLALFEPNQHSYHCILLFCVCLFGNKNECLVKMETATLLKFNAAFGIKCHLVGMGDEVDKCGGFFE
ncbi:hypothetical protein GC194_12105 [bacterium]|nr:hypothetical protein [bacterium]